MVDINQAFFTVPEMAELLRVHENTIYKLIRSGKMEYFKVGAQIRICRSELDKLRVERKESTSENVHNPN